MKKLKTTTKNFIFANIKHNASKSSYPTRKLGNSEPLTDNNDDSAKHQAAKDNPNI